jgi:hypothetical protein
LHRLTHRLASWGTIQRRRRRPGALRGQLLRYRLGLLEPGTKLLRVRWKVLQPRRGLLHAGNDVLRLAHERPHSQAEVLHSRGEVLHSRAELLHSRNELLQNP